MKTSLSLALVDACRLAGNLAFSIENALTLTVSARHGPEVAEDIQFKVLRSHQKHHFLPGLEKLKFPPGTPDTVRCAKYHVLSNSLGGLRVRYGEGNGKAWVVYDTPYWIDSPWSPGIAAAAIRPELLIKTMTAWHANNGVLLENPRLGYAQTTLVARGDACDAGYFFEAERDLGADERMHLRFEEGLPADLKLVPPEFDEDVWPLERQAKAWRNFSVTYIGGRLFWLSQALGEEETAALLEHCARIVFLQNRERLHQAFGIEGEPSPERAFTLWNGWHQAWGDEIEAERESDRTVIATVRRSRMHEAGEYAPPHEPMPASFETAMDRAWASVVAYDCPGVEMISTGSMRSTEQPWRSTFRRTPGM